MEERVRIALGFVTSLALVILIIILYGLITSPATLESVGSAGFLQAVFILAMHPYSFIGLGLWIILVAYIAGALIGGLIAKDIKYGAVIGIATIAWLFLLQIMIGFFFAFPALIAWYGSISLMGGNIIIDIVLGAALLIGCGALGGFITSRGE